MRFLSVRYAACAACVALLVVAVAGCEHTAPPPPLPVRPQVVVIGLDGADWEIIEPLVAAGRLPSIARLMARGSYGTLDSIEPMLSPVVWTTIVTGKLPHKHGIAWFAEAERDGDLLPISSRQRRCAAIWSIVSRRGLTVGALGFWASWPAERVNGWMVSDRFAVHGFGLGKGLTETRFGRTYPEELAQTLAPLVVRPSQVTDAEIRGVVRLTDAELATRAGEALVFTNPLHHLVFALANNETHAAVAARMLSELSPDLTLVYLEAIDTASHLFMKYADPPLPGLSPELRDKYRGAVAAIYERQDAIIGQLVALAPAATFVVVSDHGFRVGAARPREAEGTDLAKAHTWHRKEGIVLVAGPGAARGRRLHASVSDVTPTLLALLGLPSADDMDGRVVTEALAPIVAARAAATPPVGTYEDGSRQATARDDSDAAGADPTLQARLEALGYVQPAGTPAPGLELNRAQVALAAGDLAAARRTLDALLARDPDRAPALLLLAAVEERSGAAAKALTLYGRLAHSADAQLARQGAYREAVLLLALHRAKDAERILRRLRADAPGDPEIGYHLGLALEQQGELGPALAMYREVAAAAPQLVPALNNGGSCALRLGMAAEARRLLEQCVTLAPTHAEARFNLALLEIQQGRREAAVAQLEAAVTIQQGLVPALWELARLRAEAGELDAAEESLAALTRAAPERVDAWLARAAIASRQGREEDAKRFTEQAQQSQALPQLPPHAQP